MIHLPFDAADLPPLLAADDVLEVVRAEPVDEHVRGAVARRERDAHGRDRGPVRRGDVGVRAAMGWDA